MADEYGTAQLAVLEYHCDDAYSTPETEARKEWYNVPGYPTMIFDGYDYVVGGGPGNYSAYKQKIDAHLLVSSPMTIDVGGTITSLRGNVISRIQITESISDSNVYIKFVVYEDQVTSQQDKTYRFVVRDILPDELLTISNPGQSVIVSRSFNINPDWVVDNIGVAVFVQDYTTKHVLQSSLWNVVTVTLSPESTVVPRLGTLQYTVTFYNNTDVLQQFDYWADVILPNGQPFARNPVYGPTVVEVPAGQRYSFTVSHIVPKNAPLGSYTYLGRIGQYGEPVVEQSEFEFEIIAGVQSATPNQEVQGVPIKSVVKDYITTGSQQVVFDTRTISAAEMSDRSIQLYNLNGQLVHRVLTGQMVNQNYWDGKDTNGYPVANGIYFYQLSTQQNTKIKKIFVIKY